MALGGKLKAFVQRCVNVFSYRIEKLKGISKQQQRPCRKPQLNPQRREGHSGDIGRELFR